MIGQLQVDQLLTDRHLPAGNTSVDRTASRVTQLDMLRGVAILLVLGRHINRYDYPSYTGVFFSIWQRAGWIGVDLFFVLSGFLIAGLLFREQIHHGRIRFARFFTRRGFKIYPSFYVMIGATLLYMWRTQQPIGGHAFFNEMFFLQNYGPGLCGYTWSLAVEEHFYILLPLALVLMSRRSRNETDPFNRLPVLFICLAAGILAIRVLTVLCGTRSDLYHNAGSLVYPTHLRMDSLLFGVVLSYLYHYRKDKLVAFFTRRAGLLAFAGILCVSWPIVVPHTSLFTFSLGFTLLYLGFGILLILALQSTRLEMAQKARFCRLLAYIGTHSYSIYLWHGLVARWTVGLLSRLWGSAPSFLEECSVYVAGSILLGIAAANIIEIPMLRVRDALFPSCAT